MRVNIKKLTSAKAKFHFLVMPRLLEGMDAAKYRNLRSLLQWDRARAKETILGLRRDSEQVIEDIEDEMIRLYGFKWKVLIPSPFIWTGFHAAPSMDHLHMHIISSDLVSPSLKNKKHYNSFHPKLGFFLHLDDVLEWFDGDESYYQSMSRLPSSKYEPLLKEDLKCWRCYASQKNIPTLKDHLQFEWDRERERAMLHQKRKRVEEEADEGEDGEETQKPKSNDDNAKRQRVEGEDAAH
ncbi:hypothetical protein FRC17_004206 [Serendipita sp. 399]|nr:hypothetical protein FRC17_004206 [Serendipita sp. 399]